jgi:hypothetical protein
LSGSWFVFFFKHLISQVYENQKNDWTQLENDHDDIEFFVSGIVVWKQKIPNLWKCVKVKEWYENTVAAA